jgi:hypothetical protein
MRVISCVFSTWRTVRATMDSSTGPRSSCSKWIWGAEGAADTHTGSEAWSCSTEAKGHHAASGSEGRGGRYTH